MVFEDFYDFAWLPFEWLLKPTWLHFWTFLGAMLAPSWHQIASKIDLKNDQKMISFWIASGSIFSRFCSPTWHLYRDPNVWVLEHFGSWSPLGAKMGPRPVQETLQDRFWWFLGSNLVDFGSKLGGCWLDFGSNLTDFGVLS